jgi:hypothetical protein
VVRTLSWEHLFRRLAIRLGSPIEDPDRLTVVRFLTFLLDTPDAERVRLSLSWFLDQHPEVTDVE